MVLVTNRRLSKFHSLFHLDNICKAPNLDLNSMPFFSTTKLRIFIPYLTQCANSMQQVCLSKGKYLRFIAQKVMSFPNEFKATIPLDRNLTVAPFFFAKSSSSFTLQRQRMHNFSNIS